MNASTSRNGYSEDFDLVGGPFAVIESDPGVFTMLIRKLGIKGIEVEEVYDVESDALAALQPLGLILCFTWSQDKHHPSDFLDPAAKHVWFANQLSDDACSSLAILNVLFNCPDIDLGDELKHFRADTSEMNAVMKGLSISNLHSLRKAQNSLARPADIWGATSAITQSTKSANVVIKKPIKKRRKLTLSAAERVKKASTSATDTGESYHFIGYVPSHGKVWELDGFKSGPLEVGALESPMSTAGWEDVVRPALRLKMEKYGAAREDGGNIQFNLLAIVRDRYEAKSDELELSKRRRLTLERRLGGIYGKGWQEKVDSDLLSSVADIFGTLAQPSTPGPVYAKDFGARKQEVDLAIVMMSGPELLAAWEACAAAAMSAKIAVDEELQKAMRMHTESVKRTHDYEPFVREYITALHNEGLLADLLYPDKEGKPAKPKAKR